MRLNWRGNDRQSPTDHDDITPAAPTFEFDYRRNTTPGSQSWPKGFGPNVIGKAWKAGLVVVAEIEGYPHPVAALKSRWGANGVLLIETLEGPRVPERIWTRKDARGLTSSGLLTEEGDDK